MSRLTNKKLNNLLKQELDSLEVPNVKEQARKTPIYSSTKEEKVVEKSKLPNKKAWVTAFCMCCAVVICTCLGIFIPQQQGGEPPVNLNAVTYVTIDINPSVTIKMENQKVVDITNNNKDGGIVLAGVDKEKLVDKPIKEAIDEVLTSSASAGYLVYGNNYDKQKKNNAVKIGVINEDGNTTNEIAEIIEEDVKGFFEERNLFALVVLDNIIEDKNNESLEKYGITYSKLRLIESVYLVQNKKLFISKNDVTEQNKFDAFVEQNKEKRVSELYKELLNIDSLEIEKVYSAIYELISHKEEFEQYVKDNAEKTNSELDNFIKTEIEKAKNNKQKLSALIEQKEQSITNELKTKFDSINITELVTNIKQIFEESNLSKEEIRDIITETVEWIKSIVGEDSSGIFDSILDNSSLLNLI